MRKRYAYLTPPVGGAAAAEGCVVMDGFIISISLRYASYSILKTNEIEMPFIAIFLDVFLSLYLSKGIFPIPCCFIGFDRGQCVFHGFIAQRVD